MMAQPVLKFLNNEADQKEGLGNAGVETFRGTPYTSCAREAAQNSLDAVFRPPANGSARPEQPVVMTFDVQRVAPRDLPFHARLREAIHDCQKENHNAQGRERQFLNNASGILDAEHIPVLKIADYNTKGLTGPPDQPDTPFHSLVKGSGVSTKGHDGATSTGSHGIGKNASFAVSDLRTAIYATCYRDPADGRRRFAAQGRVQLLSHTTPEEEQHLATGFWGNPDRLKAITNPAQVPGWMRRAEFGTSVFCVGFRDDPDWAPLMAGALVSNFVAAIHRGAIHFKVDGGRFDINADTLEHWLADQIIDSAVKQHSSAEHEQMKFARQMHRCLVADTAEDGRTFDIPGLGRMRARILVAEGMPRRCAFVRNGMLITRRLRNFPDQLVRFDGADDFIALIEPSDSSDGASTFLKNLETPKHDDFSADFLLDEAQRKGAVTAMNNLARQLRDFIREKTKSTTDGIVILDDLSEFFVDDDGTNEGSADESGDECPQEYIYTPAREPSAGELQDKDAGEDDAGGSSTGGGSRGSTENGNGLGEGSGTGGTEIQGTRVATTLSNMRNRIPKSSGGVQHGSQRLIHFNPTCSGSIEIEVRATGIHNPEKLAVTHVGTEKLTGGKVTLAVTEGERCSIRLTFDPPYTGPIELLATHTTCAEVGK